MSFKKRLCLRYFCMFVERSNWNIDIKKETYLNEETSPFELYIKLLTEYFGKNIDYDPNSIGDLPQNFKKCSGIRTYVQNFCQRHAMLFCPLRLYKINRLYQRIVKDILAAKLDSNLGLCFYKLQKYLNQRVFIV